MLKKLVMLAVSAVFVVSISACGKQDAEKPMGEAAPGAEGEMAIPQKGQEAVVNVPAEIKSAWKAIKVTVNDKTANTTKEYTVNIGGETQVPGTKLTIQALEYLPNFVMQGLNITSASNEPNNPAAKVVISEGGQEVFKGWLFQKFPETHAFNHPQYSVMLVEGVASK